MTLAAQIVTDAMAVFLNEDDFAETIEYYPASAAKRDILAVIERAEFHESSLIPAGEEVRKRALLHLATAAADTDNGIDPNRFEGKHAGTNGDLFRFDGKTWTAAGSPNRDAGMFTLAVISIEDVSHYREGLRATL